MTPMTQKQTFGTGDINLAAALFTLGIDPDEREPIKLIAKDDGRDYLRFCLVSCSRCGKWMTADMMAAWDNPSKVERSHPLSIIMDFLHSKPQGCTRIGDYIKAASDFLGVKTDVIRATVANIEAACGTSPESPQSYVCAFIVNKFRMIDTVKTRDAKGLFQNHQSVGKSIAMIPAKAPARIRDFLLSKIR